MADKSLLEFFEGKAKSIPVVGEIDANKIYTMDDYVEMVTLQSQAKKNDINLGDEARIVDFDSQGHLTRIPRDKYVVNEEIAFANRIRANADKSVSIVIDYRAISEQQTGNIYATSVTAYNIKKNKNDLVVESVTQVTEQEFINEFTQSLKTEDAKKLYEVVSAHRASSGKEGVSIDDLF